MGAAAKPMLLSASGETPRCEPLLRGLPKSRADAVGVRALYLPQDTLVFGGCLHTRHPACSGGRVRD